MVEKRARVVVHRGRASNAVPPCPELPPATEHESAETSHLERVSGVIGGGDEWRVSADWLTD